jgi:hypothetical protein
MKIYTNRYTVFKGLFLLYWLSKMAYTSINGHTNRVSYTKKRVSSTSINGHIYIYIYIYIIIITIIIINNNNNKPLHIWEQNCMLPTIVDIPNLCGRNKIGIYLLVLLDKKLKTLLNKEVQIHSKHSIFQELSTTTL